MPPFVTVTLPIYKNSIGLFTFYSAIDTVSFRLMFALLFRVQIDHTLFL